MSDLEALEPFCIDVIDFLNDIRISWNIRMEYCKRIQKDFPGIVFIVYDYIQEKKCKELISCKNETEVDQKRRQINE